MPFLSNNQITDLNLKISSDPKKLKKIYNSKKKENFQITEDHNLVDDLLKEGWIIKKKLKTKTVFKRKTHSKKFEDDVWCQFYDLGFTTLNIDETLELPFSSRIPNDKKQIDVFAINDETASIN